MDFGFPDFNSDGDISMSEVILGIGMASGALYGDEDILHEHKKKKPKEKPYVSFIHSWDKNMHSDDGDDDDFDALDGWDDDLEDEEDLDLDDWGEEDDDLDRWDEDEDEGEDWY